MLQKYCFDNSHHCIYIWYMMALRKVRIGLFLSFHHHHLHAITSWIPEQDVMKFYLAGNFSHLLNFIMFTLEIQILKVSKQKENQGYHGPIVPLLSANERWAEKGFIRLTAKVSMARSFAHSHRSTNTAQLSPLLIIQWYTISMICNYYHLLALIKLF